jgi:quercetin dioxygenase-like cupin family protein
MEAMFRTRDEIDRDAGGAMVRRICGPGLGQSDRLTVLHGTLGPGDGHGFHLHPDQDEVIHVVSGQVEQWIGAQVRILGTGEAALLPAGTVHATFHTGTGPAQILAIFGPSRGDGFEVVDMSAQEPWASLRR